jgi:hypothetical protein
MAQSHDSDRISATGERSEVPAVITTVEGSGDVVGRSSSPSHSSPMIVDQMYAEQKIPKMYEYRKKRIVKEADIRRYHDVRTIFSVHSLF